MLYRCQGTEPKFQPVAVLVLTLSFRLLYSRPFPTDPQIRVSLSYFILSDVLAELDP